VKKPDLKGTLSMVFLALNVALLAIILSRVPLSCSSDEAPADDMKATDSGEAGKTRRDPTAHLPLQGMAGFDGDIEDACLRMEGFLLDMDYELAKADLSARVPIQDALKSVKAGECSLDTPDIKKTMTALNEARVKAGLSVQPPAASK